MTNIENHSLQIFFFPFPAHGHIIAILDMVRLFGARGIKATIVTTLRNLPIVSRIIRKHKPPSSNSSTINLVAIKFPSVSSTSNLFNATSKLHVPLEQLLQKHRPDCLIAYAFFHWATDSADKFGIPRIVFHVTGYFGLCAAECIRLYQAHKSVSSESEPFLIPNLPGEIDLTRMVLPECMLDDNDESDVARQLKEMMESAGRSLGVIVNSFHGLEYIYAEHYQKLIGRKTWHIGPLSLLNKDVEEKANRGKKASINERECLKWLDSKKPNSVLYVSFGSIASFTCSQLREIAMGLEASGQDFIWVVRRTRKDQQQEQEEGGGQEWLPEGFQKRMEGKEVIIRRCAPQVLILDHEAIGGFVTHCGWNSAVEGVSAGVPMVTWPVSAEQFYNEKLVTEVLRIGVPVGVKKWVRVVGASVKREAIEKAVRRVMVGEEALERRKRAQKLAIVARGAMEDGGSSSLDLDALIQQLSSRSRH